jgi:hypothetical protein
MGITVTQRSLFSKSTFVWGSKCVKSLYLYKNQYDFPNAMSTGQQAVMTDAAEIENTRKTLLEYCKLDTWAMMKLWRWLEVNCKH